MNEHSTEDDLLSPTGDDADGASDSVEIAELQAYLQTLPHDREALLRLSTLLYRNDRVSDAVHILERLADAYAESGESEKAEQIRAVLTSRHFIANEVVEPADDEQESSVEPPQEPEILVQAAIADALPVRDRLDFRPEALPFTAPLPWQGRLEPVAKDLIQRSERDIANGHWRSALDSCDRVLAAAPGYIPILLRKAEIHVHQRRVNLARKEAADLLGIAEADGSLKQLWTICRVLLHTSDNPAFELSLTEKLLRDHGLGQAAMEYAHLLAEYLSVHGDPGEAMAYAESLLQTDPMNIDLAIDCAALHLKDGRVDDAVAALSHARDAGADPIRTGVALAAAASLQGADAFWDALSPFVHLTGDHDVIADLQRVLAHVPASPEIGVGTHWLRISSGDASSRPSLVNAVTNRNVSDIGRWMALMGAACQSTPTVQEEFQTLRDARPVVASLDLPLSGAWREAFAIDPTVDAINAHLLKLCLTDLPRTDAIAFLLEEHAIDPDNDSVSMALVDLLAADAKIGSALGVLDRLVARAAESGDQLRITTLLAKMAALSPDSTAVKTRQIYAEMERGDHVAAFSLLVEQADIEERLGNPGAATTSLQKAATLALDEGDAVAALTIYQEMERIAPEDWAIRDALIELATETGELDLAAHHLRASARIAADQADHSRRLAHLRQLIELRPDNEEPYLELANTLFEVGEHDLASKVLRFVRSESETEPKSAVAG